MAFQFDSDRLKKRIQEALGKIYTEADPTLLNKYRKVIRKEVSFFKRSYLTAYLLMEQERGRGYSVAGPRDSGRNERDGDRGNRSRRAGNNAPAAENRPRHTDPNGYPLADEDSVKLFFSVGRSRRVFPREILGMIISKTSVSRDDVGAIRILDNYSFVQVRDTTADEIIKALNGRSFRGRPLSVNYARARKDGDGNADPSDLQSTDLGSTDQRSTDLGSAEPSLPPRARSIPSDRWSVEDPSFAQDGDFSPDLFGDDEGDVSGDDDSEGNFPDDVEDEPPSSDDSRFEDESSPQNDDDRPDEEGV